MRNLAVLALGLAVLLAGCKTLNVGPPRGPLLPPRILSVVFAPVGTDEQPTVINGGEEFTVTVTWVPSMAPYRITINLGADATPTTWTANNVTSPFSHTFTAVNPSTTATVTGNYTVTETDTFGNGGTLIGTYTIGPTLNQPPTITGTYDAATKTITATVSDPDGDPVTVASSATGTITVAPASIAAVPYVFGVSAADFLAGGSGTVTLTADDGMGHTPLPSWTSATITIATPVLDADTIYAIPTKAAVAVDEEDTIIIATGVPAHAFKYMNGVGLTFRGAVQTVAGVDRFDPTAGGYYVPDSLDVGVPGGYGADGIWAALGTTSFVPAPDDLVNRATDIGGGRVRLDIAVIPLDGTESTTAWGVLCNFGLKFGKPGTYTLGFQETSVVKRTYYSDSASTEYFWGHYQADDTGLCTVIISNEITVI